MPVKAGPGHAPTPCHEFEPSAVAYEGELEFRRCDKLIGVEGDESKLRRGYDFELVSLKFSSS